MTDSMRSHRLEDKNCVICMYGAGENNQAADNLFYTETMEENGTLSSPACRSQTARLAVLSSLGHKKRQK